RGWGHLEIYSVRGGGHDLHLHAVFPLRCSTATVRGFCGSASAYRMVLSIVGAATSVKGPFSASMVTPHLGCNLAQYRDGTCAQLCAKKYYGREHRREFCGLQCIPEGSVAQ